MSIICVYNLFSLCINIIIARVSDKYLCLRILGMKDMITIRLMMFEKCKGKIDQKYLYSLVNKTGQSLSILNCTNTILLKSHI